MMSPEWFYSYYSANNFTDCKVYTFHANRPTSKRFVNGGDFFTWKPYFTPHENFKHSDAIKSISGMFHSLVIAEKGDDS